MSAYLDAIINVHLCNSTEREGIVRRSEPSAAMHTVLGGSEKEEWPFLGIYASRNVRDQAWVSRHEYLLRRRRGETAWLL